MKIINFGSLNIDHVYQLSRFVRPGETMASRAYQRFCGGKGLNQSVALARAGVTVSHAGKVGRDGVWLKDYLTKNGVCTELVGLSDVPTGHAIIQVNAEGDNCIILYGGANRDINEADVDLVLKGFSRGDILLIQNEISALSRIMERAADRGLSIVFNPAPMDEAVFTYPLNLVDLFIVNEWEGRDLTGQTDNEKILRAMVDKFPNAKTVLTLGERGAGFISKGRDPVFVGAPRVEARDTTAAGDTFIGYFLAGMSQGNVVEDCLKWACAAAALCVTRQGAAESIPRKGEIKW